MRIAIVTWITYINYGTQLQAYALQNFLKSNDYCNEIINDKSIIDEQWKQWREKSSKTQEINNEPSYSKKNRKETVKKIIGSIADRIIKVYKEYKINPYIITKKKIEEFKFNNLSMNNSVDINNLDSLNQQYDFFICGSDQIWSPFDINFNGFFFLNFATKRKISYAASIGTIKIPSRKQQIIKKWLENYSAISVREKQNVEQLAQLTQKNISFVCDPTLLLDYKIWLDFCHSGIKLKGKYILCYFLEYKEWYFKIANDLSKQLGIALVLIPNRKEHTNKKYCLRSAIDPKDFVALIKDSSYVLTDSYHGSIFSVVFSKQFLCIKRFEDDAPNNQNIRIESLFGLLGLENRIVTSLNYKSVFEQRIDYKQVHDKLERFKKESREYLLNCLI